MSKYREKQTGIVVEAVRVLATDYNPHAAKPWDGCPFSEVTQWLTEAAEQGMIVPASRAADYADFDVLLEDGTMIATPGDWIVCDASGLFVCNGSMFPILYESCN